MEQTKAFKKSLFEKDKKAHTYDDNKMADLFADWAAAWEPPKIDFEKQGNIEGDEIRVGDLWNDKSKQDLKRFI